MRKLLAALSDAMVQGLKSLLDGFSAIVVVGGQWGDEGKGKIVDLLMAIAHLALRFGGGANAGHTVQVGPCKIALHQIPSGVLHGKPCVLGMGVFAKLPEMLTELQEIRKALEHLRIPFPKIYVDTRAQMTVPYHVIVEQYLEGVRGKYNGQKIDTTMKGIAPTAMTRDMKIGVTVGDAAKPAALTEKLGLMVETLAPLFASGSLSVPSIKEVVGEQTRAYRELSEFVVFCETGSYLRRVLKAGGVVLGEGAQAAGLDPLHGTYPFVTSGRAVAGAISSDTGATVQNQAVVLVAKVFPTRVGGGPFITEMWNRADMREFPRRHPELFRPGKERDQFLASVLEKINNGVAPAAMFAQYIQVKCCEVGVTSGRGRSPGFLDLPWLSYAVEINGAQFMALTHLDSLSGLKKIPVVTQYEFRGRVLRRGEMVSSDDFGAVTTRTEHWLGWKQDITGCTREEDLPEAARRFLRRLEKKLKVHIAIVGTGPAREHLIIRFPKA